MKKKPTKPTAAIDRALKELRGELANLDRERLRLIQAIRALTGSPPGPVTTAKKGQRKKPHWSPAARKAAALRMKRYWAGQKKAKTPAKTA